MLNQTENSTLKRINAGDISAFQKLFSEYYQRLYIFAQKFVDDEMAKDFVQDCFYEIWNKRTTLKVNTSFSAYLFTIIKNKCYKHFQKEKFKLERQQNILFQLKQEELSYLINSEKSILEFEVKDRIYNTIEKLPPKCAEVFRESRFNGMTNREIADRHAMSVKAVEKHISKALKLFREEFKDVVSMLFTLFFKNK